MNANRILLTILVVLMGLSAPSLAQKRQDLERQKKANLAKIKETQRILKQTTNRKAVNLGQLRALNEQIRSQESLIHVYRSNLKLLGTEIKENRNLTNSLEKDLEVLKKEYANMIYQTEKSRHSYGSLGFIFSASSFGQLVMRAKYLQQYTRSREHQAQQITKVQIQLREQLEQIKVKQEEQNQLLAEQEAQSKDLIAVKSKKKNLVQQLTLKENDLNSDLKKRKRAIAKLDRLIAEVIRKEIEANRKADGKFELTPEGARLSSNFQGNQKRLSWPVAKGFVSSKFGLQPHPVLKGVKIENPGVDIQTQQNEVVRAVFDGEVSKIASIPGMNGIVIIVQHGEYRTVYANLSKALVKTGDRVSAKEPIGEVFTDKNGVSEVQFQVWKSFNKLDPLAWLHPK